MRTRALPATLLFAVLSIAAAARAQPAPAATEAAGATSSELPLKLALGGSKLDPEVVRKAVELELKRPVVLSASTPARGSECLYVVVNANRTVTVSYATNGGLRRTRSIAIPEDNARGAEVIALLSGNLSRDEAAELLAGLAAKSDSTVGTDTGEVATEAAAEVPGEEPAAKPETAAPPPAAPPPPPPSKPAPANALPPLLETPPPAINLSLYAPTALYRDSERRSFLAEFGLAYSRVGELRALGLNLGVLRTERDVHGLSFATFYDYTGGTVTGIAGSVGVTRRRGLRGVEFSGILNLGYGDTRGLSVSGLANSGRDFEGFQAAGLANWGGRFRGGQAAGLFDWATRFEGLQTAGLAALADEFQGAQVAGLFNRTGPFEGLQTAGGVNWANATLGAQIAGVLNRATAFSGMQAASVNIADAMSGVQVGIVNVAGDVQGLQLGVVNVAKRVDGTSIGLVSVADNGRVQPVFWASSAQPLNLAAKFTVGPVYTQAGLGYAPGKQTYTYELGMGLHFPIGRFFLEPGAHYSEMRDTQHPFDHALIEYGHYRLAGGLDLGRVSPFAGVGVLQRFAHSADAPASVPVSVEIFGGVAFF